MKVSQLEAQMFRDLHARCSGLKQRENKNCTAPKRLLQDDFANVDGEIIGSDSDMPRESGENTDVQFKTCVLLLNYHSPISALL